MKFFTNIVVAHSVEVISNPVIDDNLVALNNQNFIVTRNGVLAPNQYKSSENRKFYFTENKLAEILKLIIDSKDIIGNRVYEKISFFLEIFSTDSRASCLSVNEKESSAALIVNILKVLTINELIEIAASKDLINEWWALFRALNYAKSHAHTYKDTAKETIISFIDMDEVDECENLILKDSICLSPDFYNAIPFLPSAIGQVLHLDPDNLTKETFDYLDFNSEMEAEIQLFDITSYDYTPYVIILTKAPSEESGLILKSHVPTEDVVKVGNEELKNFLEKFPTENRIKIYHGFSVNEEPDMTHDEFFGNPSLSRMGGLLYLDGKWFAPNEYDVDDILEFNFGSDLTDMLMYVLYNEDPEETNLVGGEILLDEYFLKESSPTISDPDDIYKMQKAIRQLIYKVYCDDGEKYQAVFNKFVTMLDYLANFREDEDGTVGILSFETGIADECFISQDKIYLEADADHLAISYSKSGMHPSLILVDSKFMIDIERSENYDSELGVLTVFDPKLHKTYNLAILFNNLAILFT